MALRRLRMICAGGDKTLAEWDTETVTQQRLTDIEKEFNEKVAQGGSPPTFLKNAMS